MEKRTRLVFFAPDMAGGGAERVLAEFVNRIDRARFDVSVVLCAKSGPLLSALPRDIPIWSLDKRHRWAFPQLVWNYRRLMARLRPTLVISFLWYADAIQLLGNPRGILSVCSIHTMPSGIRAERFGAVKVWLLGKLYRRADAVLAVSRMVAVAFAQGFLRNDGRRIRVQPNPLPLEELRTKAVAAAATWHQEKACRIVAVGRLAWEKGFDRLLDALALLPDSFPWQLALVGDGEMRARLQQQTEKLGIADHVMFLGFLANPYPYIESADVLALSSHFEAYPSVILEAFALGTPVVAVDCPTGPAELLGPGRGVLVPQDAPQAMASGIIDLINDPERRARYVAEGLAFIAQMDAEKVTRQLEVNLLEVSNPGKMGAPSLE